MAITNPYCSLSQLKADMHVTDNVDDSRFEIAIAAASRQIDAHTGRRFWQDGTVVARTYFPSSPVEVDVDDISTVTGLLVKIDTDDDGVYETTVAASGYVLFPTNAGARVPVWPYTRIRLVDDEYFYAGDRPTVQITAKFGWPAIPDDVTKACLVQSAQLFKASDAVFGVAQFAEAGLALRVQNRLNPMAESLLEPYILTKVA
jgi:hypothetical protein